MGNSKCKLSRAKVRWGNQLCSNLSVLTLVFLLSISNSLSNDCQLNKGFGLGFQVSQYQNDFGLGFHFNTPYFFDNTAAIRLRGSFMLHEHIYQGKPYDQYLTPGDFLLTDYQNISFGVVGVIGKVGDHIRLYGELGGIVLFPSELFSTQKRQLGWYGLFGFEFYVSKAICYFLDIGGVDSGAVADVLPSKPIYSNGFLINGGIRIQLKPVTD